MAGVAGPACGRGRVGQRLLPTRGPEPEQLSALARAAGTGGSGRCAAPRKAVPVSSAPAAHGFVDLGVLGGATEPACSRLEMRLELGGGITLHLVRG